MPFARKRNLVMEELVDPHVVLVAVGRIQLAAEVRQIVLEVAD